MHPAERSVHAQPDADPRAFWRAVWPVLLVTAVMSQVFVWLYVCGTLQPPIRYWIFGLRFAAGLALAVAAYAYGIVRSAARPLLLWPGGGASGQTAADLTRDAYRATLDLPRRFFLFVGVVGGATIGVLSVIALGVLLPGLAPATQYTIGASALASLAFTSLFAFSALKRRLAPFAAQLAASMPELALEDDLVRLLDVRTKLITAVVTVLTISMAVVSSVAGAGAHLQLSRVIALGQDRVLTNAATVEKEGDAALFLARNEANQQFLPMSVFLIDREHGEVIDAPEEESVSPLDLEILLTETSGEHGTLPGSGETVASWRRTEDGKVLFARSVVSDVAAQSGSVSALLFGAFAVAVLVATGVALLLAREVSSPLRQMRRLVEQMATGDLRTSIRIESDDEVGVLARSLARMQSALRETISAVASASERVEQGAIAVASGTGEVKRVTEQQEAAVEGMARSVGGITKQTDDIATAAEALHVAVAESSESVTQLASLSADLHSASSMLSQQTDDVSSSIEQLARGIQQVAENANALGGTTQETATAMEEIARSMAEVERGANECAALAQVAVGSAETGRERVADTVRCMEEIKNVTATAEGVIGELGGRARKIGHVVDVIDDIADETTLLALNAAIIAAQAGEHGRGFAVVAQQIKELASRVLSSTKEIAGLVSGVQEGSAKAGETIERGTRVVERGVGLSAEAGRALDEIARASTQAGERVGTIVHAVQEQASAARYVAQLSERVSSGVRQIREAGSEQDLANQAVLRAAAHTRDAASSMTDSASQQAEGSARIRASAERLRNAAERIERALQSQSAACREAGHLIGAVTEGARANGASADSMAAAMHVLEDEANALRAAVRRFRV